MSVLQSNIVNRTEQVNVLSMGSYTPTLGVSVSPTIQLKSSDVSFVNNSFTSFSVSLSCSNIALYSMGTVNLLTNSTPIFLSNSYQSILSGVATVGVGNVLLNYRLLVQNYTWRAGKYSAGLENNVTGINAPDIVPKTNTINIQIPAFISPPEVLPSASFTVNSLSQYRNSNGVNWNYDVLIATSIPYLPKLKSSSTYFSFSTNTLVNSSPQSPVTAVSATLSSIPTATVLPLSTTQLTLTNTSGVSLPNLNKHDLNYNFSISQMNMKNNFVQAGTYSVPVEYVWSNTSLDVATPVTITKNSNLSITVEDIGEIVAIDNAVNINFASVADYQNGVDKYMDNHLKISKTTPYHVYVRATSNQLSSGVNVIPLDVLKIGGGTGETGISTITLSTNAQRIISSANPIIDRAVNIRYSIPTTEVHKLLNKPKGVYSTNLIYSFVAP